MGVPTAMLLGLGRDFKVFKVNETVTRGTGLLILALCVMMGWGNSVMALIVPPESPSTLSETP